MPDKAFDLAIVDPPYGIGDFQTIGDADEHHKAAHKKYGAVDWNDSIPEIQYFNEVLRVSKEQIIWGANYYNCFSKKGGAIIWDKKNDGKRYSECEIASCTFHKKTVIFRYQWDGFLQEHMGKDKEIRIHSCQKPVALYKWLLKNYAKPGDKILDTHLGSGSIAIACHDMGHDLVGIEIDKEYYDAAVKRLDNHKKQLRLF